VIVTVTERGEFRRCRRRWYLGSPNGLHLGRITPTPALALGDLVHKTLAEWLANPEIDCGHRFMLFAAEAVENAQKVYRNQIGVNPSNDELAGLLDSVTLGKAMMENYQAFWKTPLPEGCELVASEQKIELPIPFSENHLELKLDGLVKTQKGNLFVLEHKTYGSRPKLESLNTNDQFLAYMWGATQLGIGKVMGIAYDGMWKRAVPPRGSKMEDLFIRTFLIRSDYELNDFGQYLFEEAEEMQRVMLVVDDLIALKSVQYGWEHHNLYPNRRWEGCYDCGFDPLCTAISKGEDVDYIIASMYTKRTDDLVKVEE
jgi:hypothetical protein